MVDEEEAVADSPPKACGPVRLPATATRVVDADEEVSPIRLPIEAYVLIMSLGLSTLHVPCSTRTLQRFDWLPWIGSHRLAS